MTTKYLSLIPIIIFLSHSLLFTLEETKIPYKHKKWIKEEVVYIITAAEKDVFYKLETDKERDMFIEEFWKQRDPTPGTTVNEFKREHYRRIEYANKKLKKYTSIEGWRTDQGRIYIILGDPIQTEIFIQSETYPIEMWTYMGNPALGQAPVFRLLFVRKYGTGPYELYNPIIDGPKCLTPLSSMRQQAASIRGVPNDWLNHVQDPQDLAAWKVLKEEVSLELGDAAWSAFPGKGGPVHMIPTAILIEDVKTYPQKKVQDDYAYEFLEHKAVVEVDYSVNYIGGAYNIQVLEDKSDLFFVNYAIEPDTLSVDFYQDKYFTNVRMTIRVTDLLGNSILQNTRNFPIEMKKSQLKKIKERPFHLYDSFPLIPGNYKLNLLFENMVTKEFTSIERDIIVPEPNSLQMSSLMLTNRVDKESPHVGVNRAFQIDSLQIYPCLKNQFSKQDRLYIFFQLFDLTDDLEENGRLEYTFYKGDKKFKTITKEIRECKNRRDFLEEISLESIPSGPYEVEVALFDILGRKILFDRKEFTVSATPLPTSWIVSQSSPPSDDPVYSYILGNQYLNKGEILKARDKFEEACFCKPDSLDFALGYAKSLLLQREYQRVIEILGLLESENRENFTLYYYLGKSSQEIGKLEEAISYYQKALSHKGNLIEVLNAIGECYLELGDKDQALKAWEKSLEVNPNQEIIRKLVESLKKEKKFF
jgi:GWxTD domain-containing protein